MLASPNASPSVTPRKGSLRSSPSTTPTRRLSMTAGSERISVMVRFRPSKDDTKSWKWSEGGEEDRGNFKLRKTGTDKLFFTPYTFDHVFGQHDTQGQVFQTMCEPVVSSFLQGYNGCLLAYGQTGSGKTYTMMGDGKEDGVVQRTFRRVFEHMEENSQTVMFQIDMHFLEIYMERINDLINTEQNNLKIREKASQLYVENATRVQVGVQEEIVKMIKECIGNRKQAATDMNEQSSRSHAVLQLNMTQTDPGTGVQTKSKLFIVDLAGSEQVDKSGVEGIALKEAQHVNKSLSTLSLVIHELSSGAKGAFIPYRNSVLTRLLSDSLGGNSFTTILLNCAPEMSSLSETHSTIGFGLRAKSVVNKPCKTAKMTIVGYQALIAEMKVSMEELKARCTLLETENRLLRERGDIREESPSKNSTGGEKYIQNIPLDVEAPQGDDLSPPPSMHSVPTSESETMPELVHDSLPVFKVEPVEMDLPDMSGPVIDTIYLEEQHNSPRQSPRGSPQGSPRGSPREQHDVSTQLEQLTDVDHLDAQWSAPPNGNVFRLGQNVFVFSAVRLNEKRQ